MKRARQAVLIIYVLGLCGIAPFLTPWQTGVASNSGRVVPQSRSFGSLFAPPNYYEGRLSVSLDVKVLAAEVGLWTLVAGTGWIFFSGQPD